MNTPLLSTRPAVLAQPVPIDAGTGLCEPACVVPFQSVTLLKGFMGLCKRVSKDIAMCVCVRGVSFACAAQNRGAFITTCLWRERLPGFRISDERREIMFAFSAVAVSDALRTLVRKDAVAMHIFTPQGSAPEIHLYVGERFTARIPTRDTPPNISLPSTVDVVGRNPWAPLVCMYASSFTASLLSTRGAKAARTHVVTFSEGAATAASEGGAVSENAEASVAITSNIFVLLTNLTAVNQFGTIRVYPISKSVARVVSDFGSCGELKIYLYDTPAYARAASTRAAPHVVEPFTSPSENLSSVVDVELNGTGSRRAPSSAGDASADEVSPVFPSPGHAPSAASAGYESDESVGYFDSDVLDLDD